MERVYITDKTFEQIQYAKEPFVKGDYDGCHFRSCDLSNSDLSHCTFIDCTFTDCNLSLAKIIQTSFRDIVFTNCKLTGLHFDYCNTGLFSAAFENCNLTLSCFFQMKLKKINFAGSTLHETDFTEADLSEANLCNCDLFKAVFDHTMLEKTDFRNAVNFSIDPATNKIKKAKFNKENLSGLLGNYDLDLC